MPSYVVRPGQRFGAFDQHAPGDIVELTEQEAAGFADKLAPAPAPAVAAPATPLSDAAGSLPPVIEAALLAAGLETVEQVRAASDADLLALEGVGRAALRKIRAAVG